MACFFYCISVEIWYNYVVMEKRTQFYVSRKSPATWLMALCLVGSAVARIAFPGVKGTGDPLYLWSQILLPVAAVLLYLLIIFSAGKDRFYQTAIPVWMIAAYFGFYLGTLFENKLILSLFWTALVFFSVIYTEITCGRLPHTFLLIPLWMAPAALGIYFCKGGLLSLEFSVYRGMLPDLLLILGMIVIVFAIRIQPADEYHPSWGDRIDGRRLRSLAPISQMIPYIMVNRNASANKFAESIEITHVERYIRQKRREGLTSFGLLHVFLAAYCRAVAKYPGLNRFISGQKVFSRGEDIQFCIVVKKDMTVDSPETTIKVHFSPRDTAEDVYRKVSAEVEKVKNTPLDSSFDNLTHAFTLIPGLFLKFTMWLLKTMDYFGWLPKSFLELSPFHGSIFITSLGSLGIPPVYHHLYDFGNMPMFCALGCKRKAMEIQEDGSVVQKKYIDCKFTSDERITDGFYFAAFLKYYRRIMRHPEILDNPPEEVVRDID